MMQNDNDENVVLVIYLMYILQYMFFQHVYNMAMYSPE